MEHNTEKIGLVIRFMKKLLQNIIADLPASVVVFLVALPLCLGVAVASDAAPVSGIIAGIVGGIVVGALSGSSLSVSGPAAGLTAIVASSIAKLGSYETFLMSVVLAGVFQWVLGQLKAGLIGDFIPNAVINGMLSAIGIILILKQVPHFVGYDADPEGDETFFQPDNENTFSELGNALQYFSTGAIVIGVVSAALLLLFERHFMKNHPRLKLIPGALIVVIAGAAINLLLQAYFPSMALQGDHLVNLDVFQHPSEFIAALPSPKFSGLLMPGVWITGLTIAIVASLESLLSIEAIDKLDPAKRITPTNKELKAQGIGNMVSGLLGGLPVTSVIVRSSANVNAGARSKLSTITHGVLLLFSILFIPHLINFIPKSALAAILIFTGFKLAQPSLFKAYFRKGWDQFVPFIVTILAILFSDLLMGIIIGIVTGLFFVLRSNFRSAIFVVKDEHKYLVRFRKEVSFLNKGLLKQQLAAIPNHTAVLIDSTKSEFIDRDIIELVNDFIVNAETRGIRVYIKNSGTQAKPFFDDIEKRVMQ